MNKDKFILLTVALGFLFLVIETRHAHAGLWKQDPKAYISPIACGIGFICCLAGLAAEKKLATILGWILVLLSSVGALGVWFHTQGDLAKLQTLLTSNVRQERLDHDGQFYDERPLLAPMSISGLAIVGATVILANRKKPQAR